MDLKTLATNLLMEKIDTLNDFSRAEIAAGELLGGTHEFDITELVDCFTSADEPIATKVTSWLGDRTNWSISAKEIEQALSTEKIDALVSILGVERDTITEGLSKAVPQLIDLSSRAGNLLYSVSNASNTTRKGLLAGFASKLLEHS